MPHRNLKRAPIRNHAHPLRVCKLIHGEALAAIYGHSHLEFDAANQADYPSLFDNFKMPRMFEKNVSILRLTGQRRGMRKDPRERLFERLSGLVKVEASVGPHTCKHRTQRFSSRTDFMSMATIGITLGYFGQKVCEMEVMYVIPIDKIGTETRTFIQERRGEVEWMRSADEGEHKRWCKITYRMGEA